MDRLKSMRVFASACEYGSFANAARGLGMSKSVVTRYVDDLEHHLGARLLSRTTRSLSLTEVGEAYLQRCTQILCDVEQADSEVIPGLCGISGELRILAPMMLGLHVLPRLMAAFQRQYPKILFDVHLSDSSARVVEEGLDLGLVFSDASVHAELNIRPLGAARVMLCASPDYLVRHGPITEIQDLAAHRCIVSNAPVLERTWTLRSRGGPVTVPIRPALICSNVVLAHQAALAGFGVARLSSFLAEPAIAAGRLVRVLPQCQSAQRGLNMVCLPKKLLSTRVKVFGDFLAEALSPVKQSPRITT